MRGNPGPEAARQSREETETKELSPLIHHPRYVIAVQDLERSSTCYKDVLGFEVRECGDPRGRTPDPNYGFPAAGGR